MPAQDDAAPDPPTKTEHGLADAEMVYPEGGLRAWSVVLGSFCIMLCVFGVINSAAVFELYFKQHQLSSYSRAEIGWIFSLYLFTVYFVGILVGPVFDRFGHRYLVLAGSVCMVGGPMLLSFSSGGLRGCALLLRAGSTDAFLEYYQIVLTFSILKGLGGALLNSPSYAVIGHFFYVRRGFATGIAATAGGIGGIVFPLLLRSTLESVGFAWSMRILGFILLALLIPSNFLLRTRLSVDDAPVSVWPDFRIFREPKFSLVCAGIFLMEYGVLIPLTYVMSYAEAHGIDIDSSYLLPVLLNAGSVLGRVIPGLASDKVGRFNVLLMTVGGCAVAVLALWLPTSGSKPMLIAFTFLLGFASGGNISLIPVCVGQVCETKDYGRYLSAAMLAAGGGTLTGIPIGGAILGLDEQVRWTGLILFSGLSYVASFSCYAAARILAVGWSPFIKY
ncbi:Riboflavin transporter MCH5 [Paramyrothecium foliicola]|nr:Riboflavin transporter MCH5 [Paramyrothecium foliicola]